MKKRAQKLSVFASIAAGLLAIMYMFNKMIFYISTKKEVLYRGSHNTFDWRFGKIFYTKEGSGSPILLVHDLSSTGSSYEYKELERFFSETNTVYSIDLLGCGQSEKPNIIYTNYLYVQLLSDFMKEVIQEKTTMIASRNSSSIAIMNSYIDSDLLEQLILINPSDLKNSNKCPRRKHKILKCCFSLPIIGTFIYNLNVTKHQISKDFTTDYLYKAKPVNRYETAFCEAAHTSGPASKHVFSSICCRYTNTNVIHALKAISVPILIIEGSDVPDGDRIVKEYQSYNSTIESSIILNTKGMPHIEQPHSCYSAIAYYLL